LQQEVVNGFIEEVKVFSWSIAVLKLLGTLTVMASAARGFVAFANWRESFRNRLLGGIESTRGELMQPDT
jgi:hypothetical protein